MIAITFFYGWIEDAWRHKLSTFVQQRS
jgi:hypothetical protein